MTGSPTYTPTTVSNTAGATLVLSNSAPDLAGVVCTGRVCVAVGGYYGNIVGNTGAITPPSKSRPSYGTILLTINGGTQWTSVNIQPYTPVSTFAGATAPTAAMISALQQTSPGALVGVAAASSGKYLYAVGAAPVTGAVSGSPAAYPVAFTEAAYGTILFSANSGVSWALQTPPVAAAAGAAMPYALMGVAVAKGTVAVAVGGSLITPYGSLSSGAPTGGVGTILTTMNGGFSWTFAARLRDPPPPNVHSAPPAAISPLTRARAPPSPRPRAELPAVE